MSGSVGYGYDFHEMSYNSASVMGTRSEKRMPYEEILDLIRHRMTTHNADEMAMSIGKAESEVRMKELISGHLQAAHVASDDDSTRSELIDRLYRDLFEFSVLGKYLNDDNVEEINVYGYDCIEVVSLGKSIRIAETFHSPQQAEDVCKRMVRIHGKQVLDAAYPECDSFIGTGIRVHAKIPPIIDESMGVAMSIRRQRNRKFTPQEFIEYGTATKDILDFLMLASRYGVSMGFAGGTGSGKTSDLAMVARSLAEQYFRIYVVEDTRELDLVIKDERGRVLSRVIHTKTRYSDNPKQNFDASALARSALRCDPDVIIMSEMRGAEALHVQEIARTGHTVLTTFHAEGCADAYDRYRSMCEMGNKNFSEATLKSFVYQSIPIMCYKKQLADGSRKYMEIAEAVRDGESWHINPLWRYNVTQNIHDEHGSVVRVEGNFVRVNPISGNLANRLLVNGAPLDMIERYAA